MPERADHLPIRARGDARAQRTCMMCRQAFDSAGFGERICKRCKGQAAWRSSAPSGEGRAGRRSGRT